MVLRSVATLLVGTALGAGVVYVDRTSPSVDTTGIASSANLDRESIAAVAAESLPAADRLPPALEVVDIAATCAGSMDANGDECDSGLEPTPVFAGEQTSPENHVVGCAGGADATGNDCM